MEKRKRRRFGIQKHPQPTCRFAAKGILRQKYRAMPLLLGDARDVATMPSVLVNAPYNLILTDPPYSDMLSRPRTKQAAGEATPFTQDSNDLGDIESTVEGKPP